jgi:hypothetical protein
MYIPKDSTEKHPILMVRTALLLCAVWQPRAPATDCFRGDDFQHNGGFARIYSVISSDVRNTIFADSGNKNISKIER